MALSSVSNIRNAGLMIMNLIADDELVSVRPSDPTKMSSW